MKRMIPMFIAVAMMSSAVFISAAENDEELYFDSVSGIITSEHCVVAWEV